MIRLMWWWPANARKAHVFSEDGRSLCGRWLKFTDRDETPLDSNAGALGDRSGNDDCKTCWREAKKALGPHD